MQHARPNRESMSEITTRARGDGPMIVRTDLSSLLSDYTNSQQRYNNRLESLEREIASLQGQVNEALSPSSEHELNRTFTRKKAPVSQPTSARVKSPSRIPLPITPRKSFNDDKSIAPTNDISTSRPFSQVPAARSKSFHNNRSQSPSNASDDASILHSYKAHLEQVLHKDAPPYSDIRVPNYTGIEDVIKANEQLLLENDRLRSELNRLKTQSILLIRSMKAAAATGIEPNFGNERIVAERERQELAMELARQVEENKRLRKSLLAQSTKFITLRQSTNISDASLSTSIDSVTPTSASQLLPNSSRISKSKSARSTVGNQGFVRGKTFNNGSKDPM